MPSDPDSASITATALDIAIGLTTALAAAALWVVYLAVRDAVGRPRQRRTLPDGRRVSVV